MLNKPDHISGYQLIHDQLMQRLAQTPLAGKAARLKLQVRPSGEIEIDFLAQRYRVGPGTVRHTDGKPAASATASVIAGYLLTAGWGEPAGCFVPLRALTGMVGGHGSYQQSALAGPLVKRFGGRLAALRRAAARLGGRLEGGAGSGGLSLVFDLFSKIPLQLIYYDRDADFPAEVNLLLDLTAPNFLEYEYLAVMLTVFVHELLAADEANGTCQVPDSSLPGKAQ